MSKLPLWITNPRTSVAFFRRPLGELGPGRSLDHPLLGALIGRLPLGVFVAGGFLTDLLIGREPNDVDVFFQSNSALEATRALLANPPVGVEALAGYSHRFENDAIVVFSAPGKHDLSLFRGAFFECCEAVLDRFHFSCVQVGVDGDEVVLGPTALEDIDARRLIAHQRSFDGLNVCRYARKGFVAEVELAAGALGTDDDRFRAAAALQRAWVRLTERRD